MNQGRYYDDFAVGEKFQSEPYQIEKQRIISFAGEFDPQPQHLSEETARASQFGGLVASGWHTAAVSMRLFITALPSLVGGGQGAGIDGLAWPRPVRPGDELRVICEVTGMRTSRSRPDKGLVTVRATTINQNGETVMTATHTFMAARKRDQP